jgi:predicted pyridoxine 5'-phosphate oxidase superfamily flavin-nucleotide-binding protein
MAKNYLQIAFTDSVKAEQERYGSRARYAHIEARERGTELSFAEADFIQTRDGFYLATVSAEGQPYVQFRGGAPGFVKVLDKQTLAYADFRGNLQYISVGNLKQQPRAALIFMDYAKRQRLKIFASIEVVEATDAPDLVARLADPHYNAHIERAMLLHIEAFDWNCQQHITPRYTIEEVHAMNQRLYKQIAQLEATIQRLKGEHKTFNP